MRGKSNYMLVSFLRKCKNHERELGNMIFILLNLLVKTCVPGCRYRTPKHDNIFLGRQACLVVFNEELIPSTG